VRLLFVPCGPRGAVEACTIAVPLIAWQEHDIGLCFRARLDSTSGRGNGRTLMMIPGIYWTSSWFGNICIKTTEL
jgi:hypothetical protein